jgi:hypothetical protein
VAYASDIACADHGVSQAAKLRAMKAALESMNARIQQLKSMVCRYRNCERFWSAIHSHLGGADFYLKGASGDPSS